MKKATTREMKSMKTNKLYRQTIYLLILTCVITFLSMAKYQKIYNLTATAAVANWSIKVNDIDITGDGGTVTNQIELKPEQSEKVIEGKLAPGHGGYFDVRIDPTGTEVNINYKIVLDTSNLPTDVVLAGYNIGGTTTTSDGATPIQDNTINGEISISENRAFDITDTEIVRIFWMWNDVRENDSVHTATATDGQEYNVGVNVTVTQVV